MPPKLILFGEKLLQRVVSNFLEHYHQERNHEYFDHSGIAVATDVAQVTTPTLMVTAHGASARSLASTRALGLYVVEATCPLVQMAHRARDRDRIFGDEFRKDVKAILPPRIVFTLATGLEPAQSA